MAAVEFANMKKIHTGIKLFIDCVQKFRKALDIFSDSLICCMHHITHDNYTQQIESLEKILSGTMHAAQLNKVHTCPLRTKRTHPTL